MLAVTRYLVAEGDGSAFLAQAQTALRALAARPGHVAGRVGRSTDDPTLWVLSTEWVDIGSYRRALSAYEVRVDAVPLLSRSIDEPSAFEVLAVSPEEPADGPRRTRRAADAGTVALGEASAPAVPTGLPPLGKGR